MPRRTNPDRGDLLALAMAEGMSIAAWAKANGVNPRAAYRLAARPGVRAKAAEFRARMIDEAIGNLARGARSCAILLWATAADPEQPTTVRLSAASRALSLLMGLESHATFTAQFADLQKQVSELKSKKRGKSS
jgi:hypothetical protein